MDGSEVSNGPVELALIRCNEYYKLSKFHTHRTYRGEVMKARRLSFPSFRRKYTHEKAQNQTPMHLLLLQISPVVRVKASENTNVFW